MKIKLYICSLFFCSHQVLSLEVPVSEITYMAPWSTHVDVRMDAGVVDAGCGLTDLYRIDLKNDPGAKEKYSILLAAFMAGKKVGLSVSQCVGDRGKIQGVRLSKQ
ncbi:hypothetical protein [Psychromonas sp. Urea-02u-13]|uniref:hypothetical protein n=1 Tax=Psychromonas sp. Urea-02u-13 TaxID=2058326 RepID=UPI000C338524|nr:hypothetical protein [Psychromonas sp. Urea-02u-13]PKG37079.1 hypothetical protein CXF74_20750 [Psychromonas sp. Urea-02u-13]